MQPWEGKNWEGGRPKSKKDNLILPNKAPKLISTYLDFLQFEKIIGLWAFNEVALSLA
jgi:hypothetical protein